MGAASWEVNAGSGQAIFSVAGELCRFLAKGDQNCFRKPGPLPCSIPRVGKRKRIRVLPNDIDVKKISNDRFLALMDLGRMDFAFRAGLLKSMIKNRWLPLATLDTIRFRYPLKLFQ